MKIAVITDDYKTISAHFGRAQHYLVFTIEDSRIVAQEVHDKAHHDQFADQEHNLHQAGEGHGTDPAAQHHHGAMMDPISDCQVLLAGGMGMGAHNALVGRGIQPILTEIQDIEQAVKAYIDGTLIDHPQWLH